MHCDSCAGTSGAMPPVAWLELPWWMPVVSVPRVKFRHCASSPCWHHSHEREPARRAGEPGVQHHALAHAARAHPGAGPFDARHHLVSQHLRERDQGRHRIVDAPVQEHLLVIAAAQAAELRAQHHPVGRGQLGIRDLAQPDRGERPDERPRRERTPAASSPRAARTRPRPPARAAASSPPGA